MRRAGGACSATAAHDHLPAHLASPCGYLEEPLKAALLDSLARQDVGELSVGIRDEEAGGHVFLDELGDARLRAGADGGVGGGAVQLAWLCGRGAALVGHFAPGFPPGPTMSTLCPSATGAPPASIVGCWWLPGCPAWPGDDALHHGPCWMSQWAAHRSDRTSAWRKMSPRRV